MIGIIDMNMGNIASVQNALNYIGVKSNILSMPEQVTEYEKFILPGVGAFASAMDHLNTHGWSSAIKEFIVDKEKPILGICLGMQLLLQTSQEHGHHSGLGVIEGEVLDFTSAIDNLPIPHVGWNIVRTNNDSKLFDSSIEKDHDRTFYFVHRFYCDVKNKRNATGVTEYGISFDSAIEQGAIFGTQFHPEKSQKPGLNILRNFSLL